MSWNKHAKKWSMMQDLYKENCKELLQEIIKALNTCGDTLILRY